MKRQVTGCGVTGLLAAATALLGWAARTPVEQVRAPGPASPDAVISAGAAICCGALLAWLTVAAALCLCTALTGHVSGRIGRLAERISPALVRRAVGLTLGIALAGGTGLHAASASGRPSYDDPGVRAVRGGVSAPAVTTPFVPAAIGTAAARLPAGWSPDRPATPRRTIRGAAGPAAPSRSPGRPVLVRRGDTLWGIAARHLGPGASDAAIAAEWPRWHAANSATIGPDPDLLVPGQRLYAPRPMTAPGRRVSASHSEAAPTTSEESS